MWRSLLRGFVAIACALVPGRLTADAPSATSLLDQYARGDFTAVTDALAHLDDFGTLLKQLKTDGPAWIAAGPSDDRPRRLFVAATVALEAARADEWREWKFIQRQDAIGPPTPPDSLYWKPPPQLIAWGAGLFRAAGPPTPLERWWQLAAIAVAERAEDFEFLIGSPYEARGNPEDEISYLTSLVQRFPHEPRFVLAQGIALEWRSWPSVGSWPSARRTTQGTNEAMHLFESLAKDDAVGAEAAVRLGEMRLRLDNPGPALKLFDRADASTRDPYVVYLARFLKGQALERENRAAEAIAAYRAALAAVPRAQSASVALAAQLFLTERRSEAVAALDGNLTGGPQPVDPWRVFADADDRFWPELIAHLRGEIAR
jgi:hypothetical protein